VASQPTAEQLPVHCQRCQAELQPGAGNFFLVNIEAIADPTPPIITAEDLAADIRHKIEELLAQMQGLSEQEAMDQVYRRVTFHLCGPCFRDWSAKPAGPPVERI